MVGSYAFDGENCKISIMSKGGSGSVDVSGRIVSGNISGFARNIGVKKTHGRYIPEYSGYNPANIDLTFIYDKEDEEPLISYIGSSSSSGTSLYKTTIQENSSPTKYKIKFEFNEYTSSFNNLTNSDNSLRVVFYNACGVSLNSNLNADTILEGNLTFTVFPFNQLGSSNFLQIEKGQSDSVSSFNSLETNYDNEMGY